MTAIVCRLGEVHGVEVPSHHRNHEFGGFQGSRSYRGCRIAVKSAVPMHKPF